MTVVIHEAEEPFGDYSAGRYAWLLADVVPLEEPIEAKGALGLWKWTSPLGSVYPALSLTQPWADLVCWGAKLVETRSWPTTYRGPVAIHAAKGVPAEAWEFAQSPAVIDVLMGAHYVNLPGTIVTAGHRTHRSMGDLPLGAVVATARIEGCVATDKIVWARPAREAGWYRRPEYVD